AQIDVTEEEKSSLLSEIHHWKTRVQKLLDKFQRVDPEAHNKLVEDHEQLKKAHEELIKAHQELTKAHEELKTSSSQLQEQVQTLQAQVDQQKVDAEKRTASWNKLKGAAAHWKNDSEKKGKQLEELK